jgi:hypothetical protein
MRMAVRMWQTKRGVSLGRAVSEAISRWALMRYAFETMPIFPRLLTVRGGTEVPYHYGLR